jgi:hypothetical protein
MQFSCPKCGDTLFGLTCLKCGHVMRDPFKKARRLLRIAARKQGLSLHDYLKVNR